MMVVQASRECGGLGCVEVLVQRVWGYRMWIVVVQGCRNCVYWGGG